MDGPMEYFCEEDEFDLMYGDELELLQEQEDNAAGRSLNTNKQITETSTTSLDASLPNLTQELDDVSVLTATTLEAEKTTNKRTIEELFGDIDDILYSTNATKRRKQNEHESDYKLIDRIVELRRLAREGSVSGFTLGENINNSYTFSKNNLSLNVPNYPFIGVTKQDGLRIYVRFHSPEYELEERNRIVLEINDSLSFKDDLWNEAESLINNQMKESEIVENINTYNQEADTKLLVDVFKPRRYVELLSDESTNRVMLRWLKLWDKVVFNRLPKVKVSKNVEEKKMKVTELCTDLDEHARPFHKVALLCGPPGLGKTTLAHMVARHVGYNVVEINASDDRTIDAFKTTLENATQMRSIIDAENRPNCIIFDEIDGAPSASIDYLVKFITGVKTKAKKKQLKQKNILKRPIICICNDVYVPSLRPLRQIAFVVNFPTISDVRLSSRLLEIAKRLQVKTDLTTMLSLTKKCGSDIRSCLSVLQFSKSKGRPFTMLDVQKTSVGQKDAQKGLFSVWENIFFIENSKSNGNLSISQRSDTILKVVSSFGDYEKLSQGVFENYLNFKNTSLPHLCEALDWFSYFGIVNKEIYSTQNYGLSSYLQHAFVAWHLMFSSKVWQKLQYPHVAYETKMKQNKQKAIISELMRSMQPTIRSYINKSSLILDIICMLLKIIVPSFRPINLYLFTEEEKKCLEVVVNAMIDYNLNYIQERTVDGTYIYKLDPNIEEVVSFSAKKDLSYFHKQLISQEIETTKMRRLESSRQPMTTTIDDNHHEVDSVAKKSLPNHLHTLKAKAVEMPVQTPAKDFFGRIVTKKMSPLLLSGKGTEIVKNDVWYQYKEGYNNAVRKKIKISALKY